MAEYFEPVYESHIKQMPIIEKRHPVQIPNRIESGIRQMPIIHRKEKQVSEHNDFIMFSRV